MTSEVDYRPPKPPTSPIPNRYSAPSTSFAESSNKNAIQSPDLMNQSDHYGGNSTSTNTAERIRKLRQDFFDKKPPSPELDLTWHASTSKAIVNHNRESEDNEHLNTPYSVNVNQDDIEKLAVHEFAEGGNDIILVDLKPNINGVRITHHEADPKQDHSFNLDRFHDLLQQNDQKNHRDYRQMRVDRIRSDSPLEMMGPSGKTKLALIETVSRSSSFPQKVRLKRTASVNGMEGSSSVNKLYVAKEISSKVLFLVGVQANSVIAEVEQH